MRKLGFLPQGTIELNRKQLTFIWQGILPVGLIEVKRALSMLVLITFWPRSLRFVWPNEAWEAPRRLLQYRLVVKGCWFSTVTLLVCVGSWKVSQYIVVDCHSIPEFHRSIYLNARSNHWEEERWSFLCFCFSRSILLHLDYLAPKTVDVIWT